MNRSKLLVFLMLPELAYSQEFVQGFTPQDVYDENSNLNYLNKSIATDLMSGGDVEILIFRFDAVIEKFRFLCVRNVAAVDVDPFLNEEPHPEDFKTYYGLNKVGNLKVVEVKKEFDIKNLRSILISCSLGQNNHEKNLVSMDSLHDEKYLFYSIKINGVMRGGKVINPIKGSKTNHLLSVVDKLFEELVKDQQIPQINQ